MLSISKHPRDHEEYAYGMRKRALGHAFLDPVSDSEARPGICGIINENGRWQKLVDLSNAKSLSDNGLGPFTSAMRQKPSKHDRYGPIATNTVAQAPLDVDAAAAAGELPAKVGTASKYELRGDFGAVLVCHDPVEVKAYPLKNPFQEWARANAELMLKRFPEVKKNGGFYIMTSTRSARDIRITSWSDKGTSVVIGTTAEVDGAVKSGEPTELYLGQPVSEWHKPKIRRDERKVVFFGGVGIMYNKLRPAAEQDEASFNGYTRTNNGTFMVNDDEFIYDVDATYV